MEVASNDLSVQQIISATGKLSLPDLEKVFASVLTLRAQRKHPSLPEAEVALLEQINSGLPQPLRERLRELKAKRADHSINDAEYEELTRLVLQAEELHATRMTALGELALLRGVALDALMDQLGIRFPENA